MHSVAVVFLFYKMKKGIIIGILIFATLCLIAHLLIRPSSPAFIYEKVGQLLENRTLMDSIGRNQKFQFSYNANDYKYSDTLKYVIRIQGRKRNLIYTGVQFRQSGNSWNQINESIIIE